MTEINTASTIATPEFTALVKAGALVVVNHSGGKDSQATYAVIRSLVPHAQIVVVHADLGEVEWGGVKTHIAENIDHELHIAQAIYKDGAEKTLLNMVERRGMFPSSAARWCTSDLKRGPAEKVIRRLSKETGRPIVISCFGFRAEESSARAKRPVWSKNERNSKAGRVWFDFNPIHDLTTKEVFEVIASVDQEAHPAYAAGNERLSCVFCIFGSRNDLRLGAAARPELFAKYVELEQKVGHTIRHNESLADIVAE